MTEESGSALGSGSGADRKLHKSLTFDTNRIRCAKNYRPVSQFISKVVEKAVWGQFLERCKAFDLLPDYQSAYREDSSCETAVLKLVNDALWCMGRGEV